MGASAPGAATAVLGGAVASLWAVPRRARGGDSDRPVSVQIVKELLSHGANPNLLLTKGLGSALCVACDLAYEHHRSIESKLALVRGGWGAGPERAGPGEGLEGLGELGELGGAWLEGAGPGGVCGCALDPPPGPCSWLCVVLCCVLPALKFQILEKK